MRENFYSSNAKCEGRIWGVFALHWELFGASGAVSGSDLSCVGINWRNSMGFSSVFSMNNMDCYSILGISDKTGNRGLAKIKFLGWIKGAAG